MEIKKGDPIMEEMVLLMKSEYDQLLKDQQLLEALRNAGVDNWDGYSYALEEFNKENQ